ncbi:MAG: protoporphyrinogen oxidase HemJ [Candidatus Paracaedimonas acanthamoebae]|uniref:Protoporphyrinogen IX oxidase n=1 Tax=Candidatus Paracaedimonas acanthamoebae TaxID=244581 RepID=A0A8J7TSP5_9PROT|nr:protoporphyrinogen oxidase HemJ [Candidatus Paracaedimonas acanthamoebae]
MSDFLAEHYLFLKSLHIVFVISWMAALFYQPRLYVYHATATPGSELDTTLCVMEKRLARIIMTPAMILTFVTGISLLMVPGILVSPLGWIHAKLFLVFLLAGYHGILIRWMKLFQASKNQHSQRFYRLINEIAPILMIFVVFLVVMKPF